MKTSLWHRILALIVLMSQFIPVTFAANRPNIILIVADDLGYECVGANGGTSYRTPHLDKLAAAGVRFEHCYAQPLCTPTRVQLMTGLYNVRNYTRFGHLDPKQITFAQLFKGAGYATAVAGKWQLGGGLDAPARFGFDEYCLWQLTRRPPRYANPGLEMNGRVVNFKNGEYGPDVINQFALDFIARHKNQSFLLYYPMVLTHSPFQPTPDSQDWDPKAIGEKVNQSSAHFADMVTYMDKLIGRLVAELEKQGLQENTLILFTGDNGTHRNLTSRMGSRNVRGGKGRPTAAGMHVPLIANWPGSIATGHIARDLVDTTDFLPTLCEVAGITLPPNLKLDGQNFLPQLQGQGGKREWYYSWFARNGGAKATHEFAATTRYKLYRTGKFYDTVRDPQEQNPLSLKNAPNETQTAHKRLSRVLENFREVRPPHLAAQAQSRNSTEE